MAFDPKNAMSEQMMNSMQGFSGASKAMQAVTTEMVAMSMDSMRQTSHAFEQMQGARNWMDIVRIQQDFFRSSFEQFAQRSRRIAELATAAPMDLARNVEQVAIKTGEQTKEAAAAVTEQTQAIADKTVEDAKAATVGLG